MPVYQKVMIGEKQLEHHIRLLTSEKGGRPSIIAQNTKYKNNTIRSTNIPWGVEVTWAVLTPKQLSKNSIVKNTILGVMYIRPRSKTKDKTFWALFKRS